MPLHRGDLNDVQWQNFTLLPTKRVLVDLPLTIRSSTAFYGFTARCAVGRFAGSVWVTRYGIEQLEWQRNRRWMKSTGGTFVDSTIVRAHQRAAAGTKGCPGQQSLSSRCSSKRHWDAQKAASAPKFIQPKAWANAVCLDGGTTQRSQRFATLNTLKVKRTGRGRPKQRPRYGG